MKAILKKMDLIVNLKGFALVLLGVGVLVSSQGAWGQNNTTSGPAKIAMEKSIPVSKNRDENYDKLNNELRPVSLPNGLEPPRSNKSSDESPELTDFGRNVHKNVNIVLPPLKGFRQLADAAPIQEMYKELINKSVPVLVQTMMMVENGAATGFIGSMNMVSNLMNNTIQTQQFQLELMNLTDDRGQMKYAYAGRIQKAFEADKVTSWPAALYVANGDSATDKTDGPTKGEIKEIPKSEPFKATDDINMRTPEPTPTAAKKAGKKESFVRDRLMPKLYDASLGSGSNVEVTYKNDKIKELQDEFIQKLGDFEIEVEEKNDGIARVINTTYIKAKEGDNKQWGLSLEAKEETTTVWENLNELMHQLCKFKQDNKNNGFEPIKKITASTSAGWTPEMWKDASAPDIVITQNILEQIFLVSRQSKDLSELKCDEEFPQGNGLGVPFGGEFAPIQDGDPDICQKGESSVSPCLRFKALYHMASIIGQSRALHTYENMMGMSERFAKDPATQVLLHRLFYELLGEEKIGVYIDKNRDRWAELILYMARYMQGQQGSGGTFKPGGSNAVGISPGADKQGK